MDLDPKTNGILAKKPLHGRSVLVTGAAQGVGAAIARGCVDAGCSALFLVDRDLAGLQRRAREFGEAGVACEFTCGDLTDADFVESLIPLAVKSLGGLDALANVAGLANRTPLLEATREDWDLLFNLNAKAPFLLMRDFVKHCVAENKGGSVMNISSMNAIRGTAELTIYSATKGALDVLTKNLAHGFGTHRVRFNAIDAGWMDSPGERAMMKSLGHPPDFLDEMGRQQPFGRLIEPEDVARLAVFLLGADSYPMTGAVIAHEQIVAGGRS
jgi:NAD(P)-dependent dehydrogenase (short-subunit alcohol dehydrogenase family)